MINVEAGTTEQGIKLNATIHEVLLKLNELIEHETNVIDLGPQNAHQEFASKKLRLLTQLQSLTVGLRQEDISTVNRYEIKRLKEFLVENVQKLDLRIKAINELTGTIENAVRENESDGTYNASQFGAVSE